MRVGYGDGEHVAEGRWDGARELAPADRGARGARGRSAALRPQERLAALLGGRDAVLACEELALRARSDVDAGRHREAALQLRATFEAALAELEPWREQPASPTGSPSCARAPRRRSRRPTRRCTAASTTTQIETVEASSRASRRRCARARRAGGCDGARDPAPAHSAATSACSSSSTSPPSFTAARPSYGVGPCVTIATAPPWRSVTPGSWAIGMDLQRRADAQQQVGGRRRGRSRARAPRRAGTRRTARRRASAGARSRSAARRRARGAP